jgi:hypothetical protein
LAHVGGVAALVALAAGLRFYGLGRQGLWYDEALSVFLARQPPGKLLAYIKLTESTPPLYYLCAAAWAKLFGYGESGLRSMSALVGTLTVPVFYLIGCRLGSRRIGLTAAGLAALCPLLVWYSQEARSYALLALLSAVGLLFFLHARSEPSRASVARWATASVLALATHYMAIVTVVPEAVLLLYWFRHKRLVWLAVAAVFAAGCSLLPLALAQQSGHRTVWIRQTSLAFRLGQVGTQFAAGFDPLVPLVALALASVAGGGLLLARVGAAERRSALTVAGVGVSGVLLGLALAASGQDDLITRNVLAAWVALAAALAVGLGSRRSGFLGLGLLAVICAAWLAVDARVVTHVALQRPDWRKVLHALGPATASRVLVLQHYGSQMPLAIYDPTLRRLRRARVVITSEVDVIGAMVHERKGCWWGASCNLRNAPPPRRPVGFDAGRLTRVPDFRIVRFRSPKPLRVRIRGLRRQIHYLSGGTVLLQTQRTALEP